LPLRPPTYRPPPPGLSRAGAEPWLLVAIGAAVLAVVAAFLPWITAATIFGDVSRSGVDGGGDGVVISSLHSRQARRLFPGSLEQRARRLRECRKARS
jgi:hypothetical protein